MKTRTSLIALLGTAVLSCLPGCRVPQPKPMIIYDNPSLKSTISKTYPESQAIYSSIPDQEFEFDEPLEQAFRIRRKNELGLRDNWQTPEQTQRLGTGDCEDKAIYLSKLLTEQEIPNNVVFGKYLKSHLFYRHSWNEVDFNNQTYLLDPSSRTKLLKSEVPDDIFISDYSFTLRNYSQKEINKHKLRAKLNSAKSKLKGLL